MKAIIHIGQSKAGSTSLQSFLLRNQDALREHNIHYLRNRARTGPDIEMLLAGFMESGTDLTSNQIKRMVTPLDTDKADQIIGQWRARIVGCRDANPDGIFVASCEQLFLWLKDAAQIRGLHDFFSELFDDITYVCYLRRQEDWIASRYAQSLRSGHMLTLEEYTQKQMTQFSAEDRVNLWSDVVGAERMNLRLLETDWLTGGDLINDFMALTGVQNTGFEPPERANESFTPQCAEFARQFNMACRDRKGRRKKTEELRRKVMLSLTEQSKGQAKLRLSQAAVDQVRAHYADENARLAAAWFKDRDSLYPAKPATAETDTQTNGDALAAITLELLLGEAPTNDRASRKIAERKQARKLKRQNAS